MKRKYIISLVILVLIGLIVLKLAANKKVLTAKQQPPRDTAVSIPVKDRKSVV